MTFQLFTNNPHPTLRVLAIDQLILALGFMILESRTDDHLLAILVRAWNCEIINQSSYRNVGGVFKAPTIANGALIPCAKNAFLTE